MSKLRVYEVARDLAMDNKSLVALFQSVGVTDVRNHMSAVLPEQVDRVKRHLERQSGQKAAEERIQCSSSQQDSSTCCWISSRRCCCSSSWARS